MSAGSKVLADIALLTTRYHTGMREPHELIQRQRPVSFNIMPAKRTKPLRYAISGTWTGYRPAQRDCKHFAVIQTRQAKALKLQRIIFSDGTSLEIKIHPLYRGDKITRLDAYTALIAEAIASGQETFTVEPAP